MLNFSLVRKELREHRWALIIGTILLCAMGIFTAWSFNMLQLYENMLTDYLPREMAEQFQPILQDYTFYLWSQWHPKNLLQIGTILALILSSSAIAGEVNRGSIKYLTSLPLSRRTILLSKALAGSLSLSAMVWVGTLALLTAGSLADSSLNWGRMLAATGLTNLGLIAVYAIGVLFSSMGSDSVKSGALAAAVLLVWSAAGLHPKTAVLSPFWHMKGIDWFTQAGHFPWLSLIILALLTSAAMFAADRIFGKRQF